jgi:aminoglycoside phosphotransferase (APT) family kinase protein
MAGTACPWGCDVAGGLVRLVQAAGFLDGRYQGRARDISELGGGDWSRAFSFRLDGCDLVARFGRYGEDFAKDQEAMAFAGPDLPVPKVLEVGNALGGAYAISERHFGLFLENLDEPRWRRLLPALLRGLDHLRHLPVPAASQVPSAAGGPAITMSWREWLLEGLVDRPGQRVAGWRAVLAGSADLDETFVAGERAFAALLDTCPEIRHVLHADLLNRNVLVAGDGSRLVAVFDWGCSAYGDFLYEVAWFTFWAPWHAGLAAIDFRSVMRGHYDATGLDVPFFDERLRCYELHIGLTHLAYRAFAGRRERRPARGRPAHARDPRSRQCQLSRRPGHLPK